MTYRKQETASETGYPVLLVLLFHNEVSGDLGPALWAACREVELFYQQWLPKYPVRSLYLAGRVPQQVRAEIPLDWDEVGHQLTDKFSWDVARSRDNHRFYDQEQLAEMTREHLAAQLDTPIRSALMSWLYSANPG